jgi:hypothetical protein
LNANHVADKFTAIGARLKLTLTPPDRWQTDEYAIDIQRDQRGEFFELRVPNRLRDTLDASVLQTDQRDRHLLLLVRRPEAKLDRFLCGHDERHWFVAAVPGGASSVAQAKEALKPAFVRTRQNQLGVPTRLRNLRKNEVFRRQGEWFFVPVPASMHDPIHEKFVLRNEPLRRGAGKPHVVEQVYRVGGELVYVCPNQPNGLTDAQYRRLLRDNPAAANWGWRALRRNPRVYARGAVRHSDHATITLPDWHRVMLNTETETPTMRNVAFID